MEGTLAGKYRVADIAKEQYDQFRAIHEPVIFPNRFDVNVQAALSNGEKLATSELAQNLGKAYELRLGFFDGDEMIGWHYGLQVSADTYRMATTGLLPEYQSKGIYSSFLALAAPAIAGAGFQMILSRHYATDNQVIVPKLRFGFLVSGFELTDDYGLLLRLVYYFNPVRRKILHMRSGFQQADDEVRSLVRRYD